MASNDNNNSRDRILSEDNEYFFNFIPSFTMVENQFNQVVDFSSNEDPAQTINRYLRNISTFEIVDDLFSGIMDRERRMEERMIEIAMRESLDNYKTQEKKPNVVLCIEGELATKEHLDKSCVICKSDFELNDKITVLECKHTFNTECISEWVKYKSECPICRGKIHTMFTEQKENNID